MQSRSVRRFRHGATPVRFAGKEQLLILLLLVMLVLLLLLPGWIDGKAPAEILADMGGLASALWEEEPFALLGLAGMLALTLLVVLVLYERAGRGQLTLDSDGIRCMPPGLGFRLLFQDAREHAWRVNFEDIHRVRLQPPAGLERRHPLGLARWRLVIETHQGTRQLEPYLWLEEGGKDHRISVTEAQRISARAGAPGNAERVLNCPLCRAMEDTGLSIRNDEKDPAAGTLLNGFDLSSHNGMKIQLGILTLAGGYALVDGLALAPWKPLEMLPLWPFAATALIATILVFPLGRGAPKKERAAVTLMCAAAITAGIWPGMLRYNAATAETPRLADYQMTRPGLFRTADPGMPVIDLTGENLAEYWQHLGKRENSQAFRLVRGDGNFWQLDTGHFHAQTRQFYRTRKKP